MDRFDRDIVEFMLIWAPYGGPPEEEAFPKFGLSRERLLERFMDIVRSGRNGDFTADDSILLSRACNLLTVHAAPKAKSVDLPHNATNPPGDTETTTGDDINSSTPGRRMMKRGVWRWQ